LAGILKLVLSLKCNFYDFISMLDFLLSDEELRSTVELMLLRENVVLENIYQFGARRDVFKARVLMRERMMSCAVSHGLCSRAVTWIIYLSEE